MIVVYENNNYNNRGRKKHKNKLLTVKWITKETLYMTQLLPNSLCIKGMLRLKCLQTLLRNYTDQADNLCKLIWIATTTRS